MCWKSSADRYNSFPIQRFSSRSMLAGALLSLPLYSASHVYVSVCVIVCVCDCTLGNLILMFTLLEKPILTCLPLPY